MNPLKITCPNCSETFSADKVLQKHLNEKYKKEFKVKEKLLDEKYKLFSKLKEKRLWYENMISKYYNPQYMLYAKKTYKVLCNTTKVVLLDKSNIISYVT